MYQIADLSFPPGYYKKTIILNNILDLIKLLTESQNKMIYLNMLPEPVLTSMLSNT